jgi:CheY-like chemotaxis protein
MRGKGMILLAEDNETDALLLRRAFEKADVDTSITVVRDGQEAVCYLRGENQFANRQQHPFPLLLLLDLKMPLMDGFDVLTWLKGQPGLKRLLVVVLTSSNLQTDIDRAYDLGANSYLVKPTGFDRLIDLTKRLEAYWLQANQMPALGSS